MKTKSLCSTKGNGLKIARYSCSEPGSLSQSCGYRTKSFGISAVSEMNSCHDHKRVEGYNSATLRDKKRGHLCLQAPQWKSRHLGRSASMFPWNTVQNVIIGNSMTLRHVTLLVPLQVQLLTIKHYIQPSAKVSIRLLTVVPSIKCGQITPEEVARKSDYKIDVCLLPLSFRMRSCKMTPCFGLSSELDPLTPAKFRDWTSLLSFPPTSSCVRRLPSVTWRAIS